LKILSETNRYTVLARLRENDRRSLYVAQDGQGTACLLLVTRGEEDVFGMAALYRMLEGNELFCDFVEFFPYAGGICGVFISHLGRRDKALEDFAAEASPQLRLAALRSLVAGFVAQGAPSGVICDLLRADNLFCTAQGEVHFIYDLGVFAMQGTELMTTALARFASTIQMVAAPDLLSDAMRQLCDDLERGRFSSLGEVYRALVHAIENTELSDATQLWVPPATPRERLEAAWARVVRGALPIMAQVVFALGFVLLGYLAYTTIIAPHADNGITQIGTVEVPHDAP
jgi:hypothetical protein